MSLVARAAAFARKAHETVPRKYTGEPYFRHVKEVADLVWLTGAREEVVAAALLHDVVEDTHYTVDDMRRHFGDDVASMVEQLTDVDHERGNRATRKAIDRERLSRASNEVKTIKLADIISNTPSIVAHDPNFAPLFLTEKRALLPLLKGGDERLYQRAHELVFNAKITT